MASAAGNGIGGAAGTGGSIYGSMADVGGSAAPASSGFAVDAASTAGPTVAAGNIQTYGTADPSFMQQAGNTLERFQQGQGSGMMKAYKNFGNNPETYGYLASKIPQGGGAPASPAVTTNISYQQPQNDYLRKRRGY